MCLFGALSALVVVDAQKKNRAPTSLRVLDQRCRSASASPSTPRQCQSPLMATTANPIAPAPSTGTSGDPTLFTVVVAHANDNDDGGDVKVKPIGTEPVPTAPTDF
ncbi:hypothetical protein TW95_gp0184 [Pandoravirus inopinatum]|uniref:Uncharacterized protein n=1 Tax=Pandoravirus inopinatum TaxID=1605721 RepID=A0A0B5IW57_9VIRU|nr:hypothetical protein TW95_gp0184 [Pandoravirus inopinatum]AJF96918.1 hypothetical protein [Pandoravirus inopinatum]